jgi:RNA polymerase sigma factor (sigma-70 family)
MSISEEALQKLRLRLRFKVRHQLGPWCPDVDDVIQETFARLLRAERDGAIRNADTWAAFAVATCNNVIHEYRRNLWREAPGEAAAPEPRSSSHFAAIEAGDLVESVISQLSARDRQILRAFYLEERTVDQICAEIGITQAHFRVALFRAKERFRKMLESGLKSAAAERH